MASNIGTNQKRSYAFPCASGFRDAVSALAQSRKVNVGDLARSVLLLVTCDVVAKYPDPGEPTPDDREQVVLKSGPGADKPWRRKPRLQVRLPAGFNIPEIRCALGMALAMEQGAVALTLEEGKKPKLSDRLRKVEGEIDRLKGAVMTLAFEPLTNGVRTAAEALHILGFPPEMRPDQKEIRSRYRMLAAAHHPDSGFGHHERMTQVHEALSVLKK